MKKSSCIGLAIGIIFAIIITFFISFIVAPLILSLELFGLQDAEFTPEYVARFSNETIFIIILSILYILVLITMVVIVFKTYKKETTNLSKLKKLSKIITIISLIIVLGYFIGTIIINYINNFHRINLGSFVFISCPAFLYIGITFYFYFTILIASENNELKDIEENTI